MPSSESVQAITEKVVVLILISVINFQGLFKTVVQKVNNKCDSVVYPYEKVPTGFMHMVVVKLPNGAQTLRTNVTIIRDNKDLMVSDLTVNLEIVGHSPFEQSTLLQIGGQCI